MCLSDLSSIAEKIHLVGLSDLSSITKKIHLVGLSGLEPPTSRLSGVRSNRLSYKPGL